MSTQLEFKLSFPFRTIFSRLNGPIKELMCLASGNPQEVKYRNEAIMFETSSVRKK